MKLHRIINLLDNMSKKPITQIISLTLVILTSLSLTNLAKHSEASAQTTDIQSSILETQTLQKQLVSQNKYQAALELSERSRNRSLTNLLSQQLPTSTVNSFTNEQIKQVAKQQNATLVQYSIINDQVIIDGKKQIQASELYIWVIQPTGDVAFRNVDLKPLLQKEKISLAKLITSSRQAIGVRNNYTKGIIKVFPTQRTNSRDKLQKLHQLLITPIADLLPTQTNARIVFIPQGELFLVPFAALPDVKGTYLIEKHTIATAPSIQALDLLYQRQQKIQGLTKDVLIVGNLTMPSVSHKPGESTVKLAQLPGAEQEAKDIASIFNIPALTGDAATETAVVQKMPQARIIHLATQSVCYDSSATPCGLALAPSSQDDGWLTSEEIIKLKLKADLVVLSSDDTALGKITADGVIGLSRSFFTAGVSSVIGSLWAVSDRETAFLMTKFYQNLSKNPGKAAALRHAMLETKKKYPNPIYWAAFTLIGVL
jgi:CHAT domain-containing protein